MVIMAIHGNHGASGQGPKNWGGQDSSAAPGFLAGATKNFGVGLHLFNGILAWIAQDHRAAMQHRIHKNGDARCVQGCNEYSSI